MRAPLPSAVLLLVLLAACGSSGGDGPPPVPPIETSAEFGIVRADQPTQQSFAIANPVDGASEVTLVTSPEAPFSAEVPATVGAGEDLPLALTVDPDQAGDRAGSLRLRFSSAAGSF